MRENSTTTVKYRTLPECVRLLKASDSDSAINYNALRRLVSDGFLRSIQIGSKTLIDYNELMAVLNHQI